jgi:hypothetical protein
LEGIAEPGAICLSEDAYRQVKGRLDLAVTDLGLTSLKNIAEPVRGLFVAGRHARAGEARDGGQTARTEKALVSGAGRRRARRTPRPRGRYGVFRPRESNRARRLESVISR